MKTKGITIWEKHAEKFVLVLAAAGAVTLTAMQFIGEPNAVSTSAGEVGPGDIDELLQSQAEDLLAKLEDTAEPGVEMADPVPALDKLLAQREASLTPAGTLPQFDYALALEVSEIGFGDKQDLPVPNIPAPTRVAVGQFADALAEGVVAAYPDLGEMLPEPNGPHDIAFATAAATFDLAALRREFKKTVGEAVIPPTWYHDRPENIVDIVVEREELVDGNWTGHVTLDPIPGQAHLRDLLAEELNAATRDEMLSRLADPEFQMDLIAPTFYETVNNEWTVPVADDAERRAREREREILRLRLQRAETIEERDIRQDELDEKEGARKDKDEEDKDKGGARGGGTSGGGSAGGGSIGRRSKGGKRDAPGSGDAGFGGAGETGSTGGSSGRGDPREKIDDVKVLKRLVRDLTVKIGRIEGQLRNLGLTDDEFDLPMDEEDNPFDALEADEITVWAHDLTVTAGSTYRYRVTVNVYNPFFGRKRSLVDSQKALAESVTLSSETSEWSKALRVSPPLRVFVVDAKPHGTGSRARAQAEVYRFFNGTQWRETFWVQPGQAIGAVKEVRMPEGGTVEIDFRTTLFVLDIVEQLGGEEDSLDGPAARVLLQDLETGERALRNPEYDSANPERKRLEDRAEDSSGRQA